MYVIIESKTISWISPTGCYFRTIAGSGPALGFLLRGRCFGRYSTFGHQAQVVQKLDSAIHRINHYPADTYYGKQLRYPLDSDLSAG